MLLEKTQNDADQIKALVRSDGSGYKYMIIPGGGYRNLHASEEVVMCADGNERSLMNSSSKARRCSRLPSLTYPG